MDILSDALRGGVSEEIGGATHTFMLRNAEIERFEDKHRGIYDLWDGFYGASVKPTSSEVKSLLALGLVGAGKPTQEAQAVISSLTPADLMRGYQIAQAMLGAAFIPDLAEAADSEEKKDQPRSGGTSGA
jgi:hypothetical protein